jgi:hypothetical protein
VKSSGGEELMVSAPRRVARHVRLPFTSKANEGLVVSGARAEKRASTSQIARADTERSSRGRRPMRSDKGPDR